MAAPFESWAPYVAVMRRPGIATSSASYDRSAYETADLVHELIAQKLDVPVLAIAGEKGIGAQADLFQTVLTNRAGHRELISKRCK